MSPSDKLLYSNKRPKHETKEKFHYSDFHIVHAPYAIASPAAIFARGAKNNTISPSRTNAAPSQLVRSFILAWIYFLIILHAPISR